MFAGNKNPASVNVNAFRVFNSMPFECAHMVIDAFHDANACTPGPADVLSAHLVLKVLRVRKRPDQSFALLKIDRQISVKLFISRAFRSVRGTKDDCSISEIFFSRSSKLPEPRTA